MPFKIFQLLELPTELDRLQTHQALLVTKRVLLMRSLTNQTIRERDDYEQVRLSISAVTRYLLISWYVLTDNTIYSLCCQVRSEIFTDLLSISKHTCLSRLGILISMMFRMPVLLKRKYQD
jgi:hypothetical protein